jgi:hypothetical protein
VGEKKYDATAASMMAVLRYGNGFPWTRRQGLQHGLGIPLAAATQCQILGETAIPLGPAFQELVRQAAQWELAHNEVKQAPAEWMPWNYREQLVPAASGIDSGQDG